MRLILTNIGSLGPGEVSFDFVQGLNAIVGVNGSGKSTCVNALYFALTGETINSDTFDELITWGCVTGKVQLVCDTFSITRSLKLGGAAKSELRVGDKTLTRKKEIDSVICEMFGFVDLSVFRLVFFAEQYKAIDLIDGTDAQRVAMLSSLFGFAKLEKIRSLLLQYANTLDTSVVGPDVLRSIEASLATATAERDSYIAEYNKLQESLLSSEELERYAKIADSPLLGTLEKLDSEISTALEAVQFHRSKLDNLPKPPTAEQTDMYHRSLERDRLNALVEQKSQEYEQLNARVGLQPSSIQNFLNQLDASRNSALLQQQKLKERADLLATGKCPLTGGVPCPDLLAMTDKNIIDSQIAEISRSLTEMDRDKADMQEALRDAQQLEAELTSVGKEVISYKASLASLDVPDDFDVSAYLESVRGVDSAAIAATARDLASVQARVEMLTAERKKYESAEEVSEQDKTAAATALMDNNTAKAQLEVVSQAYKQAESRVAEQQQSKDFADTQNATAAINQDKKSCLEKVRLAFHRDNLPRLLIEDVLEKLNVLLEQELSEFSFPYTVKWCPNGAMLYSDSLGELHPVRRLSGGQKYVVVLAARCAFKRLLNTKFPFFVLDEPTTGLDVQNREYLSQSLVKFKSRYPELVMVVPTHDQMLLPESNVITL